MPSEFILLTPGGAYAVGDRIDATGYVSALTKLPGNYGIVQITRDTPAPAFTVQPSISPASGTVGQVFTVAPGTITNGSVTSRQWSLNGSPISGATGTSYTSAAAGSLTCTVTATGAGGTTSATASAATVSAQAVPVNSAAPTISGTPQVGQTLTASQGTWTNSPMVYAYQWRRAGAAISGATASTYAPISADVGSTLTVTVTASNTAGSAAATSTATAAVTAAPTGASTMDFSNPANSGLIAALAA